MTARLAVGCLFIFVVLAALPCFADGEVDPRYSYTLEAQVGAAYFGSFASATGADQVVFEGGALLGVPVGENRQVTVGLRAGGFHAPGSFAEFGTVEAKYRFIKEFNAVETRLDLGIGVDVSHTLTASPSTTVNGVTTFVTGCSICTGGGFAVAGLFGFGLLYQFTPGWRTGLDLSGGFYAINLRAQFELSPVLTYSW